MCAVCNCEMDANCRIRLSISQKRIRQSDDNDVDYDGYTKNWRALFVLSIVTAIAITNTNTTHAFYSFVWMNFMLPLYMVQ